VWDCIQSAIQCSIEDYIDDSTGDFIENSLATLAKDCTNDAALDYFKTNK
jgi:hypothetical protein